MKIDKCPHSLKIMQWNIENLFIFLDQDQNICEQSLSEQEWQKLSSSTVQNKSLVKLRTIKKLILAESPDLIFLNEVGGQESLKNLNHLFLEDLYNPLLIEGNSDRGIDVGYLVKKSLPFKLIHLTHKTKPLNLVYKHDQKLSPEQRPGYFMSRDISELRLFLEGSSSPILTLLNVHLKSKLDQDKIDKGGATRRKSECDLLVKTYKNIQNESPHKPNPVIIAGDFNGNANPTTYDPEFESIYTNSNLTELFSYLKIDESKRWSKVHFPKYGQQFPMQLDYCFLSPCLLKYVETAEVYRFSEPLDTRIQLPRNQQERSLMPSDHFPVVFSLNLQNLIKDRSKSKT